MAEYIDEDGVITEGTGGTLATIDSKLVVDLARAEIDQQISTAKQYPRSVSRASNNILSLVTLDQKAAEECMFALPRGKKPIVGPSIRLAEAVFSQWGNARVSTRVIDVNRTEKYVEAEGVFHDLETNAATRATIRRGIVDKYGKVYSDDMIVVTGNAACAIARRNAILAGVPKAVWRKAYEAAEQAVRGDIKTLAERRDAMFKAFAAYGVKPEQLFAVLEVGGPDDITLDTIPVLTGMYQAIKNGEETVESLFNPRKTGSAHKTIADPLNDEGPAPKKSEPKETGDKPAAAAAEKTAEKAKEPDPAPAATTPATEPEKAADAATEQAQQGAEAETEEIDEREPPSAAYTAGREARKNGISGKRVPDEFAADETASSDWLAGWKEEHAAQQKGGGK